MKRQLALALVALFGLLGTSVNAASIHGSASGLCPFGSLLGDGCPNAPVADNVTSGAGTYQFPNMLTASCAVGQIGCAKQSIGLTNSLQPSGAYPVSRAWNVAYIDYPVGIPASSLPLKDPANVQSDQSNCTYSFATVTCTGTGALTTLDGYDFSLHSGVWLNVNLTGSTSKLVLQNNYFGFVGGVGFATNYQFTNIRANSLLAQNNVFYGGGSGWPSLNHSANGGLTISGTLTCDANGNCPSDCGVSAAACVQYNTFVDIPVRAIVENGTYNSIVIRYNAIDGIGYPAARFTGYINDGVGAPPGDTTPGNILTITDMGIVGGNPVACDAAASANCGYVEINAGSSLVVGPNVQSANCTLTAQNSGTTGQTGQYVLSGSGCTSIYAASGTMYWDDGQHGDTTFFNWSGANTMPLMQISYNTILFQGNTRGSTAGITLMQADYNGQVVTTMKIDHNTILGNISRLAINNGTYNWAATEGASIGDNHALVVTTPSATYNYIDPTGSYYCAYVLLQAGSGALTLANNQNMLESGDPAINTNGSQCYGTY